jgi:hypothetical protein
VAFALLFLVALLLFWPVLFGGRTLFGRDITPFFYPMKEILAESIRAGRIPWWNPGIANGEPFFASLQPGVLYPFSLLLYMLPLKVSVDWVVALHYPLAGAGLWLLLRRWGRSAEAAWLGAAAFMLGGYLVSLGNFPNNLQTVAWVPWLFWGWDRVLDELSARRISSFAALTVIAFLGGEPQMLVLALSWLFVHGVLRIERRNISVGRQAIVFAGAGAVSLAVVAVQLIPFLELVSHSVRTIANDLGYAASRSLEPTGLIHLAMPPALDEGVYGFTTRFIAAGKTPWILSPYPGALVSGVAILGFTSVDRRRSLFWGFSGLLGVLIALGAFSPVYRFLFETIPVLRPFRYPEKFLLLPAMAVPVMAAIGADRLLSERGRRAGARIFMALGVAYACGAVLLGLSPAWLRRACGSAITTCEDPALWTAIYQPIVLRITVLLALGAAAAWVGGRGRLRPEAMVGLIALLSLADLLAAHARINPSVDSGIYARKAWPARVLDGIKVDREAYRFRGSPHDAPMGSMVQVRGAYELSNLYLDFETMGPNVGQLAGYLHQDGLQGLELRSVAMTNDASLHDWGGDPVHFLRAMNVRWYADPTDAARSLRGLREIARHPELPLPLYEVSDPLPRAYLVDAYEVADGTSAALDRTLQASFPLGERVVLETSPEVVTPGATGNVVEARYEQNRVVLHTRADGPMVLVLNDRFYPGWTASVNGNQVPVMRASGVFRAVVVPAGDSLVDMRFRPTAILTAATVSLAGLGVLIALQLQGFRQGRRRHETALSRTGSS